MATQSTISVVTEDFRVKTIYCHFDGYLEWVGKTLLDHYNSRELAEELVSFGDLSVLGERIHPTVDTHSFDTPEEGTCIYYGRDRGELKTEHKRFHSLEGYIRGADFQEFNYIFRNNEWQLFDIDRDLFIPLTDFS